MFSWALVFHCVGNTIDNVKTIPKKPEISILFYFCAHLILAAIWLLSVKDVIMAHTQKYRVFFFDKVTFHTKLLYVRFYLGTGHQVLLEQAETELNSNFHNSNVALFCNSNFSVKYGLYIIYSMFVSEKRLFKILFYPKLQL